VLIDLDKYEKYPIQRIEYCEQFAGVDLVKFQEEINKPIIP